jgi:hypothetical protein
MPSLNPAGRLQRRGKTVFHPYYTEKWRPGWENFSLSFPGGKELPKKSGGMYGISRQRPGFSLN